jgi:hypothetical protein
MGTDTAKGTPRNDENSRASAENAAAGAGCAERAERG